MSLSSEDEMELDAESGGLEISKDGLQSMADNYHTELQMAKYLEELTKDIILFDIEEETPDQNNEILDVDLQQKVIEIHPPGVAFFTHVPHQLYTTESLVWPLKGKHFSGLSLNQITSNLAHGFFQRNFSSRENVQGLMRYLLHLISCTSDEELMHLAHETLCYLAENLNEKYYFNIYPELALIVANLGGDLKKIGLDTYNQSPVVPSIPTGYEPTPLDDEASIPEENLKYILYVLGVLLKKTTSTMEERDGLLKLFLAIGLDPKTFNLSIKAELAVCISHTLDMYPTNKAFYQRIQGLVEMLVSYCGYHHHTVSHACSMFDNAVPRNRTQTLLSSLAFLQLQVSLNSQEKRSLDLVEVCDVKSLLEDRADVLRAEKDKYLVHSVVKLLAFCIGTPANTNDKLVLKDIYNLMSSLTRKFSGLDTRDMYTVQLKLSCDFILSKWKMILNDLPDLNPIWQEPGLV